MELPVNNTEYEFLREKHIQFCLRSLGVLPSRCDSLDSTRMVVIFFGVSSLDHLNALHKIPNHKELIDWIYKFQVTPDELNQKDFGFRGSITCVGNNPANSDLYDKPLIAMTYAALCSLLILGDDLSRVDRKNILLSLKSLQLPDGSFRPLNGNCENDMRFVYCASCICYILQDWSTINVPLMLQYIKNSVNYDGGIGQGPGLESHGGSTFCAVASLYLVGQLNIALSKSQLLNLKRWLIMRQNKGFHGRPNKPDDSCYTFWVGASLKILDSFQFVNYPAVSKYVFSTQYDVTGGIGKWVDYNPDLLHTYLGLSGLLLFDNGFPQVHPALNISSAAADRLAALQRVWADST